MKKIKTILTIFLVATVLFLAPKDAKAYNSAPAFRCFYETKKTQNNVDYIEKIKLLYVDGKLETIKLENTETKGEMQGGLVQAQSILDRKAYKKLENVGTSCPTSFESYGSTYSLKKGTQNIATVTDKDCTYSNKDRTPSTINVHYYRTRYWKSYAKVDGVKSEMKGFWWTKKTFLYSGTNSVITDERKGAYDSLYAYITKYSSKSNNCPPKIFYNKNHKWYAATEEILDKGNQGSANVFSGTDNDYTVYKLDKGKKCEEDLKDLKTKLSIAKTTIGTLENAVKSNDTWDEQAVNTHITQFENLTKQMQTINDYMSGCEDESSYKNLKDDMEIISKKIEDIRKKIKEKINTSSIDESKKADFLKKLDSAYKILSKLDSMDLSMYNKEQKCETIFGDPKTHGSVAELIQKILNYIKVLAPILVVILSSMDFIKVIWTSDDESMKKAQQKLGKRLVAAVLLFLLPTLIGLMFNLINDSIIDPTCKIK